MKDSRFGQHGKPETGTFELKTPPWHGMDEPEFMARVRQTFLEQLPDRVRDITESAADLADPEAVEHRQAADRLLSAAHNLKGTAGTVGAEEMGVLASRLAATARRWQDQPTPPTPEEVAAVTRDATALAATAEQFRTWMESPSSDS